MVCVLKHAKGISMKKRRGLIILGALGILACVSAVIFTFYMSVGTPEAFDATSIVIKKGGGVSYCLVEDFSQEYYDLQEFEAMAKQEAAEFNEGRGTGRKDAVALERVELLRADRGSTPVVYRFDGGDSFSGFTGDSLFYGTVEEAVYKKGFNLQGLLKDVQDGRTRTMGELMQDGKKLLVITDARARLYLPSEVSCLGGGARLLPDGSVDASQAQGTVYILLK